MALAQEQVLAALRQVRDEERGGDIVSLGMVSGLVVRGGNVGFQIEVEAARGPKLEPLRQAAEQAVAALPGVLSVTAILTAERAPSGQASRPQGQGPQGQGAQRQGMQGHRPPAPPASPLVPGVKHIIAVASGKGGVGKSTVAVNLALGAAARGLKVGLLDADIYGPSLPRMMGISGRPGTIGGKRLVPMTNYGIACMSMGFLVPEDSPMIWRGPMVMQAVQQLLRDVEWGELDILFVDLPPGTGDAQLTLAQQVPLSGAVIVSTPQDIALLDARKGLAMFSKVNVPILGIIENMSYFSCPHCGGRTDIFSHGGAHREAERFGVEFLGEIPLDLAIRTGSDEGRPVMVADSEGPHAQAFRRIAGRIAEKVGSPCGRKGPVD